LEVIQPIEIKVFLMNHVSYRPDGILEYWNTGMLILKGIYSFFALLVKRCFTNNPLSHFPESSISTFQYSSTELDGGR
jgi:hypothetical protein